MQHPPPRLLSVNREGRGFEFEYIRDFERAFLDCFTDWRPFEVPRIAAKRQFLRIFRHGYRRLPDHWKFTVPGREAAATSFAVVCGSDFAYLMAAELLGSRRYLYMFDHWPRANGLLHDMQKLFGVTQIFFSARQSAELFNASLGQEKGVWVPEGIQPDGYGAAAFAEKGTDVIEFGRRYPAYHGAIRGELHSRGISHLYGPIGDLKQALSQARISICFPSALTHPERAENISTMTLRYLQSMISKCLIVGTMPQDMTDLFDYLPIVPADMQDPAGQIRRILADYQDYIPLIERNHREVMTRHLWRHRMELIRTHVQ